MPSHDDKGIYLGTFAGDGAEAAKPVRLRYAGPKHVLCFGPPGAAKSMGLVVPNVAHLPRSCVIVDVKAQISAITYRKRAAMGRCLVLNPFGLFADELPHLKDCGWNPLRQLDRRSPDFAGDARCIIDAILSKSSGDGGNSKFFDVSAETVGAVFCQWVRLTKSDEATLNDVRIELTRPTIYERKTKKPVSGLLHTLKLMSECEEMSIRVAAGRIYSRLTDANSQSTSVNDVIDTLLKDMAFLDDPRLRYSMTGGAIDFADFHKSITTVFLVLPMHELTGQGSKFLRIFINLALRKLYQSPPTFGATLPPVTLFLDEAGNLGRLPEVIKALGASRDYSIQLFFVLQSLSQLKAHYAKEWPLFFCGSGSVSAFAPRDLETAEHLAKIIGNREELVKTETNNGGSLTPQPTPLIRPEDLMRLGRNMTVNLIEPCPWPVLAHAPVYPQTPFAAGLDPNPYFRG